jgi:hypothetical protein
VTLKPLKAFSNSNNSLEMLNLSKRKSCKTKEKAPEGPEAEERNKF